MSQCNPVGVHSTDFYRKTHTCTCKISPSPYRSVKFGENVHVKKLGALWCIFSIFDIICYSNVYYIKILMV